MNLRFATPAEVADWDQLITTNQAGTNVLQCRSFAKLKSGFGWTARYFVYDLNSQPQYFLGVEQTFPLFGKLWYLPKAPNFLESADFLACLADFRTLAAQENVFLVKFEPEMPASAELSQELTKLGLRTTFCLIPTTGSPSRASSRKKPHHRHSSQTNRTNLPKNVSTDAKRQWW